MGFIRQFKLKLSKFKAKIDALHKAVEDGDIRRADTLIDHSYMALARDKYGMFHEFPIEPHFS